MIEIADIFGEHFEQVALAQDNDVIETLTTHATEEALTGGVHIWRSHGGPDDPRSEGLGSAVEVGSELAVPVADDETRSLAERRRVAHLLSGPLLSGSARYRHVQDFARGEFDDKEREDGPKPDVVRLDEIAGPDVMGVVFEEGRPALAGGARLRALLEIPLDRALRDADAELKQLAPDALRAPKAIFTAHATDEFDRVTRDAGLRFLLSRPPSPEHLKPLPMPSQKLSLVLRGALTRARFP